MLKIPQVKAKGMLLWWGRIRFLYGYAAFYIGAVQLLMLALVTYNTTARDWALQYGIQLQLWQFVLALLIIVALGFLAEYCISIPGMIAVSNEQMYAHDSPIKTDFEEVKKSLKALKEELATLRGELQEEAKKRQS
jgi:hypothetical protein